MEINNWESAECVYQMITQMFGEDKDIVIEHDSNNIYLIIDNVRKADALRELLKTSIGDKEHEVHIHVNSKTEFDSAYELMKDAFADNPIVTGLSNLESVHVMFRPDVIQINDGNSYDPYGKWSGLYKDLAEKLFRNASNIAYSTDCTKQLA